MRPTREGRVSPSRPGLVYRGIGIDPEAPTEDPPDPTDRATGADAEVPYLPPPEAGPVEDLNLSLGTDSDGGGNRPVTDPTNANDGNSATQATRASFYNGGGTKTWWLEADLGSALDVDEIVVLGGFGNSGENDPPWEIQHSPDSSTWTTAVGSYVWDDTTNPNTATLTLSATQTKRYWRVGQTITYAGLIYPLKVHTFQINGPSTGTPTNIIWVEAPLTIDGDDATYDYAYDTGSEQFWRVDLGDTYLIDSIDARLAYETAGSNPLVVKATNESDYTSLVTVATIALTATGTFTAQNVTGSWTPSTAYRYWVLEQTTEDDIRIYRVELLTSAEGGVTDHPELTGRDTVDSHPADAVSYDNGVSGLTADDVQEAIDELASASPGGSDGVPSILGRGVNGGSTASLAVTIGAASSGRRLLVVIGSNNRDVNAPTCTNVTFTSVLQTNFSTTSYLSVYVGVATGTTGTTVTITATGSDFIAADVYTIADTLTPTAGTPVTVTNTDAAAQLGVKIGAITPAAGTFWVCAAYQVSNTTPMVLAMNVPFTTSSIRGTVGSASTVFVCAFGYALGGEVFGYTAVGGTSGSDYCAGIVAIT